MTPTTNAPSALLVLLSFCSFVDADDTGGRRFMPSHFRNQTNRHFGFRIREEARANAFGQDAVRPHARHCQSNPSMNPFGLQDLVFIHFSVAQKLSPNLDFG